MSKNRNLVIISLIAIVNALGYGIIIPVLYSYSVRFGLTDFQNGLLFALFSACQFFSTPVIGRLSDKYGRKPLLVASIAGSALSFFMMAFAPSWIFLFLARALDGFTAGNLPVAQAVISDTTTDKERAKGFGMIGASFGFGFIFGPAISALTVGISPSIPFIIAGVFSIVAVLMTVIFLPETNKHMGEISSKKLWDFGKLIGSLGDKNIGPTLIVALLSNVAFMSFIYGFNSFSVKGLHLLPAQISLIFTLIGVLGVVTQFTILHPVLNKLGTRRAFYGSIALLGTLFTGLFFVRSTVPFMVLCILVSLPNSFVGPLINTILSKEADVKSQGSIMGLAASYMSIGQVVGPILGGTIASLSISSPFLAAGFVAFLCVIFARQSLSPDHHKSSAF